MKSYFRNKQFIFGSLLGALIIGIINIFSKHYSYNDQSCFPYLTKGGFPFVYFESCNSSATFFKIQPLGLIGDILFTLFFILGFGLILKFIVSKISLRYMKLN